MVGSRPDSDLPDDELDPTGVRDMLANLPDPGPMPADLVARISQSLLLEQERRAEPAGEAVSASPISLDAERQRRRPGRTVLWLGGAAAVAMVATVSVNQLFDDGSDSGVSAQAPARDASEAGGDAGAPAADAPGSADDADDAGDVAAPTEVDSLAEAEDGVASPQSEGEAAAGAEVLGLSGTLSLSSTDVAAQVQEWLSAEPAPGAISWTTAQVNDCIDQQNLDTSRAGQVLVANATWSADPAMVLVARADVGGTAWVLTPDCDAVLTGPVTLD